MERLTRGSVINGYLKFVKKRWGQDALDMVLAKLGIDGMLKDGQYYTDEYHKKILEWIGREKGGEETLIEAGKYVVQDLGILSWMVRLIKFSTMVDKAIKHSNELYKFGHAEWSEVEPNVYHIKLYDICYFPERCHAWKGVFQGALKACKTKGVVTKELCQLKGNDCCLYKVDIN